MARTPVVLADFRPDLFTTDPVGTAADPTNGHVVDYSSCGLERIVLRIKQTNATPRLVTIKAGTNPPAMEAGQGDLTKSMAQNETWWVGPLTSGRFGGGGPYLYIDLAPSFAGTITALHLSRGNL
jgi:hypothetical protein